VLPNALKQRIISLSDTVVRCAADTAGRWRWLGQKGCGLSSGDGRESLRIRQLAERMVHISRISVGDVDHPYGDAGIRFAGVRPGEHLHVDLPIAHNPLATARARIFEAQEPAMPWSVLVGLLDQLTSAAETEDELQALALLGQVVTGFDPKPAAAEPMPSPAKVPHKVIPMLSRSCEFHGLDLVAAIRPANDPPGPATAEEAPAAPGYGRVSV